MRFERDFFEVRMWGIRVGALMVFGALCGCPATPSTRVPAGVDTVRPRLVFQLPQNGAQGVDTTQSLVLEFSEPMAKDSVSIRTVPLVDFSSPVWTYMDTVVEFKVQPNWMLNTSYTVTVKGEDLSQNSLEVTRLSFSTGAASSQCTNVSCDPLKSNACEAGRCVCGLQAACGSDSTCAKPVGFAQFQCFPNCPTSGNSFNQCGPACQACDEKIADGCQEGACTCGANAACAVGQKCQSGQCVCDTEWCAQPTVNGCCQNQKCVPSSQQTIAQCKTPKGLGCENFTLPLVRADSCQNGVAQCGASSACDTNSECQNGTCVAKCSSATCSEGCCEAGQCYRPDAGFGLQTSPAHCGTNGDVCLSATFNNADTCTEQGVLVCGFNLSACTPPRDFCEGGICICSPTTVECGSGSVTDCCQPGQWCSTCSLNNHGSCDWSDRTGETCFDFQGNSGSIFSYKIAP